LLLEILRSSLHDASNAGWYERVVPSFVLVVNWAWIVYTTRKAEMGDIVRLRERKSQQLVEAVGKCRIQTRHGESNRVE
jgi:hypothetical protein